VYETDRLSRRSLLITGTLYAGGLPIASNAKAQAQEREAIHFTDGMRPFEVRYMADAWAPAHGATTFRQSQPPPWNSAGGKFGASGQIGAWSGGCVDPATRRLFFAGGGHSDGANNGIHVFDWSGRERPVGFSTLAGSRSRPEDVPDSYWRISNYADGRPNAVHTYSHMLYSAARKRVYRGGGWFWAFEENVGAWKVIANPGLTNSGSLIFLSPDESELLAIRSGRDPSPFFYNVDTQARVFFGKSPYGGTTSLDPVMCFDPKRQRYLTIGSNKERLLVHTVHIDWPAHKWSLARHEHPTHAGMLRGAMGMAYDAHQDCFWCVGGKGERKLGSFDRIVRVDAQTLESSSHPLSEPVRTASVGQYGRIMWMPDKRAIGLLPAFDSPAVVIKIPA
jgi:hypothetical protein